MELFEYGAAREGYWTGEKFMLQLEKAFKIDDFKYNPDEFTIVRLFDQSSCHKANASDTFNVDNMNVKPGGKQAVMHDTWAGKTQELVDSAGVPKGMKIILEERGINTQIFKTDDMRVILANLDVNVIKYGEYGDKLNSLLMPTQSLHYLDYEIIEPGLDSVSVDLIRKYFRKARDYERAYRECHHAGIEVKMVKHKSHRHIFYYMCIVLKIKKNAY